MPATATASCTLPVLGPEATQFDLETAFKARGAAILACDVARQLAVDVQAAEHVDIDAWLQTLKP